MTDIFSTGIIRSALAVSIVAVVSAAGCGAPPVSPPVIVTPLSVPPLGPPPPDAPAGLRFRRVDPIVGAKWHVTVHARSVEGGVPSSYASAFTAETLAVNGPAVTRLRIAFERNLDGHDGSETPTKVHRKTYVLDASEPHVTTDGAPAPSEEADAVLDVFPDLGLRPAIDQVLPEGPIAVGDERNDLARAIMRTVHPRWWALQKGRAAVVRIENDAAVFEVAVDALSRRGIRLVANGDATVRLADARLVAVTLEGAFKRGEDGAGSFSYERVVEDR